MQAADLQVLPMSPKRALLAEIVRKNTEMGLSRAIQLPGYLRSEVVLGTANEISFALGENQQANGQAISPTENRLRINDAFFITHFGVMFYTFTTADGIAGRARARLRTFDNAAIFGANAPEVLGAYNGKLSLRVNDTVFIDSMDMMRFYNVGTAQEGLEVSTGAVQNAYLADSWANPDMFALETDPLVRLDGPGSNRLSIQLPDSLVFTQVPTESVVAVAYCRGWLSQNGGAMRSAVTR